MYTYIYIYIYIYTCTGELMLTFPRAYHDHRFSAYERRMNALLLLKEGHTLTLTDLYVPHLFDSGKPKSHMPVPWDEGMAGWCRLDSKGFNMGFKRHAPGGRAGCAAWGWWPFNLLVIRDMQIIMSIKCRGLQHGVQRRGELQLRARGLDPVGPEERCPVPPSWKGTGDASLSLSLSRSLSLYVCPSVCLSVCLSLSLFIYIYIYICIIHIYIYVSFTLSLSLCQQQNANEPAPSGCVSPRMGNGRWGQIRPFGQPRFRAKKNNLKRLTFT